MNVKKICLLGSMVLLLFQHNVVNAYEEKNTTQYKNSVVTVIQGSLSEENTILEDFTKEIEINGTLYTTSSIERNETNNNTKIETKQKTEILNTRNEETIKKHFGNTYLFEDEEFKGELPITNIEVKSIGQGNYEEIDEKRIDFEGYSQNDLNNVKKEITLNNIKYYLIKVDWKPEKVEIIDNQEVPLSYQGTMIYQTVLIKKNPDKYEITVTYSGEVKRTDTIYEYSILYQPVVEENIENKPKENDIVPLIISGIGVGIIIFILLINKGNIKVYNKTDKGNKLITRFKVSDKNKVIDITKYQYKTSSNIYCLKLNNKLYEKMKNKTIYLQIDKIKKQVYINAQYIEIII